MKTLEHPNVVKLYNTINKNNNTYLILEYCDEGDLTKYIESKVTIYDSKFFNQILRGLKYLYQNNILHRDIKPQNILISDKNIKISDFGLAKSFEKYELINTFCGSPLYMAPEIIKNRKYTLKSDIWSLGVVFFELISKVHPYNCESKDELWDIALNNTFNINYKLLNNQYSDIIQKLLIYEPENRLSWEDLFKYDLKNEIKINIDNSIKNINHKSNIISESILIPCGRENLINKSNDNSVDEYRVFSSSAPKTISNSYLENYVINKKIDNNIPILGSSPNNKKSFNNILNKSIGTFKNLINK